MDNDIYSVARKVRGVFMRKPNLLPPANLIETGSPMDIADHLFDTLLLNLPAFENTGLTLEEVNSLAVKERLEERIRLGELIYRGSISDFITDVATDIIQCAKDLGYKAIIDQPFGYKNDKVVKFDKNRKR